jgi:DNA-binding MarR family transcriptional regulator
VGEEFTNEKLEMKGAKDSVAFMLSRVGASVAGLFAGCMKEEGFEPREFLVMNLVASHEGESQQAISESVGIAKSHMVKVVDQLEQRGLIERRPNPEDRRQHALYLTPEGRKQRNHAQHAAQKLESDLRAHLTDAEIVALKSALGKLAEIDGTPPGIHPALTKPVDD